MVADPKLQFNIIGVDCATEDARIGLSLGCLHGDRLEIQDAVLCSREHSAAKTLGQWSKAAGRALIAIDAPLGWPKPLGDTLVAHTAGAPIRTSAHAMFRRATDLFIQRELRKTPLDVGADRIARTAHAALKLLEMVGEDLGHAIPLAWRPDTRPPIAAIEVYPAATLVAHGIRSAGYKKLQDVGRRREVVAALCEARLLHGFLPDVAVSADMLDAVVCVVAGADFLTGRAMMPEDEPLARREGWIWAAKRQA